MSRKPRRKEWSKIIEESGIRVRIYERAGRLYRSVMTSKGGSKERRSLGHRDRDLAEVQCREWAKGEAEARLTGMSMKPLTLARVIELYFQIKGPTLSVSWRKEGESRRTLFLELLGAQLEIGNLCQSDVDRFVAARRAGTSPKLHNRRRNGVSDGTIAADLSWLSSVFNWARRHRANGRRLLTFNPLHDVTWPREKNKRRPVAAHFRYVRTLEQCAVIDPCGRLRCMLALARYTGRRESAICNLFASDVLLSQDQVLAALAATGKDERWAEHMPFGAIRWRAENDKQGYEEIAPLSQTVRNEVDAYLRANPRIGDVPLFPSPESDTKPLRRDLGSRWLVRAEKLAGLPKLDHGRWHPYRRLWAVERKSLPDVDVAAAGGWRDTRALKMSYQRPDPVTMFAVVQHATR